GDARVPRTIGQSLDRHVAAEAEIGGAGMADRPAALLAAELEQRAAVPIVDGDVLGARRRCGERCHQYLVLGRDVQARAFWAPSRGFRPRKLGGAPLLLLPGAHLLGARQAQ